jgi:hypothetical protein
MSFCVACGVALDPSDDEIDQSAAARENRIVGKRAYDWALGKLILGGFILACAIAIRVVFRQPTTHDYTTSYRLPYALIEGEGIDPPQSVQTEPFTLPLPTNDPHAKRTPPKKKPPKKKPK